MALFQKHNSRHPSFHQRNECPKSKISKDGQTFTFAGKGERPGEYRYTCLRTGETVAVWLGTVVGGTFGRNIVVSIPAHPFLFAADGILKIEADTIGSVAVSKGDKILVRLSQSYGELAISGVWFARKAKRNSQSHHRKPSSPTREQGVVTEVAHHGTFGRIRNGSKWLFVHVDDCADLSLQVGQRVTYFPIRNSKGFRALEVRAT